MRREARAGINSFASSFGHFITDLLIVAWNASLFVGKYTCLFINCILLYAISYIIILIVYFHHESLNLQGTWKLFGHPGKWIHWLASIAATSFASSGIGYICGVWASSGQAGYISLIVNMICCVFSGVEPKLKQVSDLPVLNWLW